MLGEEGLPVERGAMKPDAESEQDAAGRKPPKIYYLQIPTGKSRGSFWIWLPDYTAEAINAWKQERPRQQRKLLDRKDREEVDYLFCFQDLRVGGAFINESVIPVLCKRAGVSIEDAKGKITGHRGRSARSTLLRKNGVSLDDLAEYAGHVNTRTIRRYARQNPIQLHQTIQSADFRYQAGLLYVLSQAGEEGHCFLPLKKLVEHSMKRLALPDAPVDPTRIEALIDAMAKEQLLIVEQGYGDLADQQICYAPAFYHTEVALARRLASFASAPVEVDLERVGIWIDRFTEKRGITLSTEQRRAVELAASSRLLVLTGGPGCGKTFTTRTIVALWRAMRKSILLAAPTGRAAQRLAELTHVEAKTIHRLLAFDPGTMKFRHDEDHPLEAQAFVVDETSMLAIFFWRTHS